METGAFSRIPFDQRRRRVARDLFRDAKAGLDFVAHNLPRAHRVFVRVNPYPKPWRALALEMPDGARLAAWHAKGAPGAPAVVMVPGTFQTKDDTPRKRRAIDLWRRLGVHVLIFDQRGFGGSATTPPTLGEAERRDVFHAADWLRHVSGAAKVHLWGESLGASTCLLAATLPHAEDRFERVVAWSPFADLLDAARASRADDPRGRTRIGRAYRFMLRAREPRVRDFRGYMELRARELGVPLEEIARTGSPALHAQALRVPSFVVHAEDDPVVPVAHARLLAKSAGPHLHVFVAPRGGHLDFDRAAPAWYAAVTREFLSGTQARARA